MSEMSDKKECECWRYNNSQPHCPCKLAKQKREAQIEVLKEVLRKGNYHNSTSQNDGGAYYKELTKKLADLLEGE